MTPQPPGPLPMMREARPKPPSMPPGAEAPPETGNNGEAAEKAAMYHGPDQFCEECSNFEQPSTCQIGVREGWPSATKIDPGGWCKNFTAIDAGGEDDEPVEEEPVEE